MHSQIMTSNLTQKKIGVTQEILKLYETRKQKQLNETKQNILLCTKTQQFHSTAENVIYFVRDYTKKRRDHTARKAFEKSKIYFGLKLFFTNYRKLFQIVCFIWKYCIDF